jgi:glycosyltransferase involved in cell wall biosynthesis
MTVQRTRRSSPNSETDRPGGEAAPTPVHVLFLNRDLFFHGGVANVLLTLAIARDSAVADLSFASLMTPSAEMRDAFQREGASVSCVGDRDLVSTVFRLRALIKADRVDVVVPCSFRATLAAYLATRGLGVTVVPYLHAIEGVIDGEWRRRIFRLITRTSPMMFVSKAVMAEHRPQGHTAPVAVVQNGVADPFDDPATIPFGREIGREFGVPDDALLIGYLAAFVPVKDHETLLAAFRLLDPELNAYLIMIGKLHEDSPIPEQLAQGGMERVQIVPPRADARRILGGLDIYVHTSRSEGFGLAIVEAMLAGTPVVAVRGGAVPEYIDDGRNGLLAEPGDARERFGVEQFAARVTSFLAALARADVGS